MSLNFFGWPPWMILKLLTPMLSKNDQSPTYFRFLFAKIIWHLSFRVLDMTKDEWEYLVITSAKLRHNTAPKIIKNTEQDITNTPTFLPRIFLENFNCHFNINGCWYIGKKLVFLIKAILKLSYYNIRSLIEHTVMNLPNFACQGHTAGSVACSCRNKHGTYDENDSVNLVKTIIPKH